MKHLLFVSAMSLLTVFTAFAANISKKNSGEDRAIREAVKAFAHNADARNIEGMRKTLHKDFRAIANRLFGSNEVSLMEKTTYLHLLEAGKIGGDRRKVSISNIIVIENNASVHAEFQGKEVKFNTIIQLVKDESENWQIISDMPFISKIE